jgi:hypothetical protein
MILLFIVPISLMAQQLPDINLTFGNYIDDQVEHKFTSNERVWNLHGDTLDYSIDANDLRYVDTLILNNVEVGKIIDLLLKNEPLISIKKEVKSDFMKYEGVTNEIRGVISFNSKVVDIFIKSNGYNTMDEDKDTLWIEELEQLFYEIIENHR